MKLRHGILLLLALALVAAIVVFARRELKYSLSRELPDGSMIRIAAVSLGTNHFYAEPKPAPWQLAIGRHLPFSLGCRLGWRFDTGGSDSVVNPPGMTNLVIFVMHDGLGKFPSPPGNSFRLTACDEHGNSFDATGGGGNTGGEDVSGKHFHLVQSRIFEAYPRRDKTIALRFLSPPTNGGKEIVAAEFHVPNPVCGLFPTWTPEALPNVKSAGDINVTLKDFVTGIDTVTRGQHQSKTRVTFQIEESNQTNSPWKPKRLGVSDATGNAWFPYAPPARIKGSEPNIYSVTFPGTLWPGETAWKLRLELTRTSGFAPDEVLAARAVPIAAAGGGFSTNINGCQIQIEATRKSSGGSAVQVSLSGQKIPEDYRLNLVGATDDHGRPAKIKTQNDWLPWRGSYDVTVPSDTTQLDLALALHKSRFAEFIASPMR